MVVGRAHDAAVESLPECAPDRKTPASCPNLGSLVGGAQGFLCDGEGFRGFLGEQRSKVGGDDEVGIEPYNLTPGLGSAEGFEQGLGLAVPVVGSWESRFDEQAVWLGGNPLGEARGGAGAVDEELRAGTEFDDAEHSELDADLGSVAVLSDAEHGFHAVRRSPDSAEGPARPAFPGRLATLVKRTAQSLSKILSIRSSSLLSKNRMCLAVPSREMGTKTLILKLGTARRSAVGCAHGT